MTYRNVAGEKDRARRRGFTLIEVLLSVSIATVIVGGMASAVLVASKALPKSDAPAASDDAAPRAMRQLLADLRVATSFTVAGSEAVEFTVGDRDKDAVEEIVRYSWSKTAGDPLVRSVNGAADEKILDNVHQFQLDYSLLARTLQPVTDATVTSAETLLASNEATVGLNLYALSSNKWIAQIVCPTIPSDALSWQVTRAEVELKSIGVLGTIDVLLIPVQSPTKPVNLELGKSTLATGILSLTSRFESVSLASAPELHPRDSLALAVRGGGLLNVANVGYVDRGVGGSEKLVTSSDAGTTWSVLSGGGLRYRLYGTIKRPAAAISAAESRVQSVTVLLQRGPDAERAQKASVQILNAPLVGG